MGDRNAKVGREGIQANIVEKHGFGKRNRNGEKLVNFGLRHNLKIGNTSSKKTTIKNGLGSHQTTIRRMK